MRKTLISLALCVAIVLAGLGVSGRFAALFRGGDGRAQAEPIAEEKLPNVAVQVVSASLVEDILYLTGIVEPWEEVILSAETRGKIEWLGLEEGDRVEAGQELIKVNITTIEANMEQALAEYTSAQAELDRVEELRARGISSPQEYDKALMARDTARARLRLTEIQLDQSVVTAPFDGVVNTLEKEAGEFVDVGTALVHLVQVDRVKINVGLPEREIANFGPGDRVELTVDADPNRVLQGQIHRIATSAERSTRTFSTEVEVDNSDGLLRPGMIARVKFVRRVLPNAITVPLFSVITRQDGRFVFVEENGMARERAVEVGFMQHDFIHVVAGLSEGDRLIVAGHRDLRDGQRVNVQRVTDPR